ncbi:fasciclin domain-containing protein [Reichenbachiella ulvae]|uniref:Fasciclin domain-containing protein n=1 Tax=Reichenbachiella ulvae TaxID=2980104 RepID=A0ABT3CT56_9BACT|nr:fasciclin domain-containing protein [Reichenbachiella ulvae]MCV9386694.1 fasciclin domain-containing protein [Reichenbachiella ulvae]
MKDINNRFREILTVIVFVILATGCDLTLQEEWEYVREPFGNRPTGMTAYDWMVMINQDTTYNDDDGVPQFQYLLDAIEQTDLIDLYNDPNASQTYFLLRNSAFNASGQLLAHTTGSADNPLDSLSNDRLEHVLRYHILEEALSQETIPKNDFHLYYQTLVPGDSGVMEINKRLFNQQIRINTSVARVGGSNIPTTMPDGSRGRGVDLHNFIFTNGIGHQINGYVRYQPF